MNADESSDDFGLFLRSDKIVEESCIDPDNKMWWDRHQDRAVQAHSFEADPRLMGEFETEQGKVKPAFQLLKERVEQYTPEWAEGITGISAQTIRRLAHEMGITARDETIELPIPWT